MLSFSITSLLVLILGLQLIQTVWGVAFFKFSEDPHIIKHSVLPDGNRKFSAPLSKNWRTDNNVRSNSYSQKMPTNAPTSHPDIKLTVEELILKAGYPVESHQVTTADGYILTLHRIPHGRNNKPTSGESSDGREPLLMQHGLMCGSACWILNSPNSNVGAYRLADEGYDVWLGNARGSVSARNHTYLNPKAREFWQFSWAEMGEFDVPAMIDYILATTQHKQLTYIGHSMGTTMFWVAMSERPEYNSKIRVMFALGPVGYVSNVKSPIRLFSPLVTEFQVLTNFLGEYEFYDDTSILVSFKKVTCTKHINFTETMCLNTLFFFSGFDPVDFNQEYLPVILTYEPEGTSVNCFFHYAQMINTGTFQKFDFGRRQNLAKYGQDKPPHYNITKITAPVVLMWAQNDWLADRKDVAKLAEQLPNLQQSIEIPGKKFNHLDFMWGRDTYNVVYRRIIKYLPYY